MAMKIPKPFKDEYTGKRFEREILKRIFIESSRKLVLSLYILGEDGLYRLKSPLTKEEIRKLADLGKSVRKNKGAVRTVKIAVLLTVTGGIVAFGLFFKNPLAERTLERGLESLFEAKADVNGMNFAPLRGRLSLQSLTVADRDRPLRNLFVLGRTTAALNMEELVRGSIVIEEVTSSGVDWNTEREKSGALPGADPETGSEPADDAAEGESEISFNLPELDPKELVAGELENLMSIRAIEELDGEITEAVDRWTSVVESGKDSLDRLSATLNEIRSIDPKAIKTAEEAKKALAAVQEGYPAVESLRYSITSASREVAAERGRLTDRKTELQRIIEADYEYIRSKVALPEGGIRELAASIAEPYLRESLGKYYDYGKRALEIVRALGRSRETDGPDGNGRKRMSRLVPFPRTEYPSFLIEDMRVSLDAAGGQEGYLEYLSSDQELTGLPTTFGYSGAHSWAGGSGTVSLDGSIDLRESADGRFALSFSSTARPLEIESLPDFTGLDDVSGTYDFTTAMTMGEGAGGGTARALVRGISLSIGRNDEVSSVLYGIVTSAREIQITADYSFSADGGTVLKVRSSLDDEIRRGIGRYIEGKADIYREQAEASLGALIGEKLRVNDTLLSELVGTERLAEANVETLDSYAAVLRTKQREIESRIKELAGEEAGKLLDSIKDAIKLPKSPF